MRSVLIAAVAVGGLLVTAAPVFAQGATATPGSGGTEPLSRNGSGRDSVFTGTSEGGGGGTGGAGGVLSNGTSDNAGTASGGRSGGNANQGASGG